MNELRASPTVGTAHLYIYPRIVSGLGDETHCIGHYRLETWRQIGEIVQPGIGRREVVLPNTTRLQAALQLLCHVLTELKPTSPPRLIIHHAQAGLPTASKRTGEHQHLRHQLRTLLTSFSQIHWQQHSQADLLTTIGAHIQDQNALWYHDKAIAATKGLYQ